MWPKLKATFSNEILDAQGSAISDVMPLDSAGEIDFRYESTQDWMHVK